MNKYCKDCYVYKNSDFSWNYKTCRRSCAIINPSDWVKIKKKKKSK